MVRLSITLSFLTVHVVLALGSSTPRLLHCCSRGGWVTQAAWGHLVAPTTTRAMTAGSVGYEVCMERAKGLASGC